MRCELATPAGRARQIPRIHESPLAFFIGGLLLPGRRRPGRAEVLPLRGFETEKKHRMLPESCSALCSGAGRTVRDLMGEAVCLKQDFLPGNGHCGAFARAVV